MTRCPACERPSDENRTCAPWHPECVHYVLAMALDTPAWPAIAEALGVGLDWMREQGRWWPRRRLSETLARAGRVRR